VREREINKKNYRIGEIKMNKYKVGQKVKFEVAEYADGNKEYEIGEITRIEGNKYYGISEDWFEFEIEDKHIVEVIK